MPMNRPILISILQSMLLILLSLGMGYLLLKEFWFSASFICLLLLITIVSIIQYQNHKQRIIKKLITAIQYSDFSISFNPQGKKGIEKSTALAMEQALAKFRDRIHALEETQLYQHTLLSTIDSGLIVLNQEHQIEWCNQAALRELRLKSLQHISDLGTIQAELPHILLNLKAGEIKVVSLEQDGNLRNMAFNSILFQAKNRTLSLISLKNIHTVLENKEIESWQKLISVLTHEIMNSMAPIISLSETLLEREMPATISDKNTSVTQQVLQTIHRRSKGLLEFIQNYRKLSRIPKPVFSQIHIAELFSDLQKLHASSNIQYQFNCTPASIQISADRTQLEQILINLIRNAEEACAETASPQIKITAYSKQGNLIISVQDNGAGIIPEAKDKIFVPFFTTKTSGSGIGLTLCKQIMALHNGNIKVNSTPEKGSCFELVFNHQL